LHKEVRSWREREKEEEEVGVSDEE